MSEDIIKARIVLQDDFTQNARKVAKEARNVKDSLEKTTAGAEKQGSALERIISRIGGKKIAVGGVDDRGVKAGLSGLEQKIKATTGKTHKVGIADGGSIGKMEQKVGSLRDKLRKVTGAPKALYVKALGVPGVKSALAAIENKLKRITGDKSIKLSVKDGLKGLGKASLNAGKSVLSAGAKALGIGALAAVPAATAFAVNAMKGGALLEEQQVSMRHFVGDDKKADAYFKDLRTNANLTPFETGEVIAAGTRAVQISGGDTGKAMDLVKMAEDMAGLTPGKSIEEAMEALGRAKMGEWRGMRAFGFTGSAEELEKAGGDIFKVKNEHGKTLGDMFGGGAEKLSKTSSGLWSTITGNVKAGIADTGLKLLDRLKPTLEKLIPVAQEFGEKLPEVVGNIIDKVAPHVERIGSIFSRMWTAISPIVDAALPVLSAALSALGWTAENILLPVFEALAGVIGGLVSAVEAVIGFFSGLGKGDGKSQYSYKKGDYKNLGKPKGKNAAGTLAWGGGMSLVGELGPELISLPRGTQITPAGRTKDIVNRNAAKETRGGGQFTFNITLNDAGNVDADMLARVLLDKFKREAVNVA